MHFGSSCLFLSCTHRKFHDKKNANFLGIFHGGVDNKCIFRICKHGATENLKKVKFASEQNSTRFAAVSQNILKMSISLALPDADELMKWLSELHCICYFNHPNSSASDQFSNFTTWKRLSATLWASWHGHWERQMMSDHQDGNSGKVRSTCCWCSRQKAESNWDVWTLLCSIGWRL